MDSSMPEQEGFGKIVEPFREFMLSQVREKDLRLFEELAKDNFKVNEAAKGEIRVLIPAFMISELSDGGIIIIPIDMVIVETIMPIELLRLTEPAALFAHEALEWLHKRALKRGRRLLLKPPEERHRVRIPNSRMSSALTTTRQAQPTICAMPKSRLIRKLRKPRASFSAGAGEAQFTPPTTYDKHGSPLSEPARSGAD